MLVLEYDDMTGVIDRELEIPILLLGTLGTIKYKTRFQKLAFLYDHEISSKPTYEWTPHRFGPYSYQFKDAIKSCETVNLVKCIGTNDPFGRHEVKYNLTINGHKIFRKILNKFNISKIRPKLLQYQSHNTNYQLLLYVYKKYPSYTINSEIKEDILHNQ